MILFPSVDERFRRAFCDKHVIVTGASSGIGRCVALRLASAGAKLTLIARTAGRLSDAADDARAVQPLGCSAPIISLPCDCSDAAAVDEAFASIDAVDVLVNCAGGAVGGYFEDLTAEVAEAQMRGNYFSQLYPTRAVFKLMKESGEGGHLVLTSSVAGLVGVFGYSAYAPAKYALRGLGEVLYYEGRSHGIEFTICYPPDTDTPGYAKEQLTMPEEALAISKSAGVFAPDKVAEALLLGVIHKQKRVMIGLEGKMLGILTAGMTPGASFIEILLMPIMRLLSLYFVADFNSIIRGVQQKNEDAGPSVMAEKED
eukprot:Plantae.Rhodophyta-Palmaria_palmata.ctg4311.p1 GENE.Plantae.Rhodophyta-Palmaria_palmata.ctg4311~~Plantae.Rhodophyta-Palmaria_palmata.ctg4311.p1  ORF type:complete len:331 (+),score=50.81 Plantae.Rhodophyta-Palmaria_palmata.ctg4311:52-993(+)